MTRPALPRWCSANELVGLLLLPALVFCGREQERQVEDPQLGDDRRGGGPSVAG